MGKPVKIHKKNSFMFTNKEHSFCGILGTIVFALSVGALSACLVMSYKVHGVVGVDLGGVAFFAAALNIIGLIGGVVGLQERDVYRVESYIALGGNGAMLIMWIILAVLSKGTVV